MKWRSEVKSLSRVRLFATLWYCSPPGSSVHGIFQARVLEWVAVSFSSGSSQPMNRTQVSRIVSRCFYHLSHQGSLLLYSLKWSEVKWSRSVVSDSLQPHGRTVHGIFQARVLEWIAISFSRGSSWPRNWTQVSRIAGRCFTVWATSSLHLILQYCD